jgi:hypothetical protein
MTTVSNDPASMRAAAARLRAGAEGISQSSGAVDSQFQGVTFVGPAGDTFRLDTIGGIFQLRSAAVAMQELADRLVREADVLEQEQLTRTWLEGGAWS